MKISFSIKSMAKRAVTAVAVGISTASNTARTIFASKTLADNYFLNSKAHLAWLITSYIAGGGYFLTNFAIRWPFIRSSIKGLFSPIAACRKIIKDLADNTSYTNLKKVLLALSRYAIILPGIVGAGVSSLAGFLKFIPIKLIALPLAIAVVDAIQTFFVDASFIESFFDPATKNHATELTNTGELSCANKVTYGVTLLVCGLSNAAIQAGLTYTAWEALMQSFGWNETPLLNGLGYTISAGQGVLSTAFGGRATSTFFATITHPRIEAANSKAALISSSLTLLNLFLLGSSGFLGAQTFLNLTSCPAMLEVCLPWVGAVLHMVQGGNIGWRRVYESMKSQVSSDTLNPSSSENTALLSKL